MVNELEVDVELVSNILVDDNAIDAPFTDTEKQKLAGIEAGAQVNTVTSVNGKTGAVVLTEDDITITVATKAQIDALFS